MPDYPTKFHALDVDVLYIGGNEFTGGGSGQKAPSIAPLKADADTAAIAKKINEIIAAMKIAGVMENKKQTTEE